MSRPLLRRILFIALLVVTVMAGDRILARMLQGLVLRSQYRYSMLYNGGMDRDVVIIGNSRALHALYAPSFREETGLSAFNAAYNGISMTLAANLMQDYLDLNEPPDYMLIEVTCMGVDPQAKVADFGLYFTLSDRIQTLFQRHEPKRYAAMRVVHLVRFNGGALLRALSYLTTTDQTWISPARRVIPDELAGQRLEEDSRHLELIEENVVALQSLMHEAERRGVTVRLFISPFAPGAVDDARMADYRSRLAQSLGQGIDVLDYSRSIEMREAFSDRVHTNARGAALLLDQMIDDGVLPEPAGAKSDASPD